MSHPKAAIQSLCLAIPLLGIAVPAAAQSLRVEEPIRVETALVNVPVVVTDSQGRYAAGLGAGDFRLFQDGIPQPFSVFAAWEEPIRICLLLDTSKSTVTVLQEIKKAAGSFIRQLRPQDQAMIVTFDSEIRVLRPLSADHRDLVDALKGVAVGQYAGTRMRDALLEVAQIKLRAVLEKKAIVVLTDGQDFGSRTSADDLAASIAATGTPVYSVFYNVDPFAVMKKLFGVSPRRRAGLSGAWEEVEEEAARYLRQLSEATAGRFYYSRVTDIRYAFGRIAEELRHQYLLGFYPGASQLDGGLHTLRVEVSRPGLSVRGRPSYRAGR